MIVYRSGQRTANSGQLVQWRSHGESVSVSRGLCRRYSQVGRYRGSEECEAPAVWAVVWSKLHSTGLRVTRTCGSTDTGQLVSRSSLLQFIADSKRMVSGGRRFRTWSVIRRVRESARECDCVLGQQQNEAGKLKYRPYEKTDPSLCRPRTRNLPRLPGVRGGRRRGVRSVRASDGCGQGCS